MAEMLGVFLNIFHFYNFVYIELFLHLCLMGQCRNVTCIFVKNFIAEEKRRDQSERLSYKKESNIISLAVYGQYQVIKGTARMIWDV